MLRRLVAITVLSALYGILLSKAALAEDGAYLSLTLVGSVAEAQDTENEGSLGGAVTDRNQLDLVAGIGGAVGYEFSALSGRIRTEAELHHRFRFDLDLPRPIIDSGLPNAGMKGNLASTTGLVNLNYLFDLGTALHPYLGGGLGVTYYSSENEFHDIGGLGKSDDDTTGTNFTWTVNAGLLWDWTETLDLIFGYRYIDMGKIDFGRFAGGGINVVADYVSHDVLVTLGWRF